MNKTISNWTTTPILRAGTDVINTPTKTMLTAPCQGVIPRYNVGNIHEIKQFWSVSAQA